MAYTFDYTGAMSPFLGSVIASGQPTVQPSTPEEVSKWTVLAALAPAAVAALTARTKDDFQRALSQQPQALAYVDSLYERERQRAERKDERAQENLVRLQDRAERAQNRSLQESQFQRQEAASRDRQEREIAIRKEMAAQEAKERKLERAEDFFRENRRERSRREREDAMFAQQTQREQEMFGMEAALRREIAELQNRPEEPRPPNPLDVARVILSSGQLSDQETLTLGPRAAAESARRRGETVALLRSVGVPIPEEFSVDTQDPGFSGRIPGSPEPLTAKDTTSERVVQQIAASRERNLNGGESIKVIDQVIVPNAKAMIDDGASPDQVRAVIFTAIEAVDDPAWQEEAKKAVERKIQASQFWGNLTSRIFAGPQASTGTLAGARWGASR